MPRYVIERQFLVPVFEHILVEAPNLEAACRDALDDIARPWEDSELAWEDARATTIAQAVKLPDSLEPELCPDNADRYVLSDFLYCSGLGLLPILAEFASEDTEAPEREQGIGFF